VTSLSEHSPAPTALKRRLGLWSAVAVVVGSTIGSGIFRTPAGIAAKLPGPLPMMSVWIVGGLLAMCGSFTLAEIASGRPNTGGVYVFIRDGWGRMPAFLFGWSELVIIRAASLGAIATTFAEYFLRVLGFNTAVAPYSDWVHWVAAGAIAFTCIINIIGVGWSSFVLNLTGVAKYGGLVIIVVLAFALGLPHTGGYFTPMAPAGSFTIAPFGLALVSVLWAFDGWADLSFIGGEVSDPGRNLPRALLLGALGVLVIYLMANVAYLSVLPVDAIKSSKLVAADVAEKLVGRWGVVFVSVTVMLSTFGTLSGSILTSPRIFKAMADDGVFFAAFSKVHPKFETPWLAVALCGSLGVVFVLLRSFEQLADTFVTAIIPFYALGVMAVFPLRRRDDFKPTFRTPGYPVVPIVFALSTVLLLGNSLIDPASRWPTVAVFGGILIGLPVYRLTVGRTVQ
jgi:APA family basic amino acid/polyamine antiporter